MRHKGGGYAHCDCCYGCGWGGGGLGVGGWVGVREFRQNQIDGDDRKQTKTKTPQKSCHKN